MGGKDHLNEGNALRWQMQSFAMADAQLCIGSCKALRWRMQCFALTDAKLCICDGLNWYRNRQSHSGYEKREERLTIRGHCSPQESSAKPTSLHLRMNKKNSHRQVTVRDNQNLIPVCEPDGIQTHDLQNRNLTLYSAKLRVLDVIGCKSNNFIRKNKIWGGCFSSAPYNL